MTVSLFARHKVKDFDTWKKLYDESAQFVKDQGVIASSVHRDLDDPNLVMAYHQFADVSTAKAYKALFDSDLFQEGPVKVGGVIQETLEVWVGEDI